MYKVIVDFFDKTDANYFYNSGDTYPRPGYDTTEERTKLLLSKWIEFVPDDDTNELTRQKINSMSTRELKKLAKENGFGGADQMVGFELKGALIEKLGL